MIDLQPDNSLAYEDLGGTYIAMSRYKDAISVFNKGLSYRQTSSLLTNLGSAYMYLEMYPEAAAAMEEATKLDPHNDILWRNLGDSYRQLPSRAADATAAYEKALQAATEELRVNPNDTEVLSGIALYTRSRPETSGRKLYYKGAKNLLPRTAMCCLHRLWFMRLSVTAIKQSWQSTKL